ncbi:hypothetical protein EVAR_102412_1 [Eumeta japonica]|uniref:Uncharacterized protein n=1 Tax=Eumeta variegata TaxID=151549 RepID=A0A4C1YZV1_EUMVA|nr:hypothetical protein EVAR_102412_1 [Eumeta japonica]
MCTGAHVCVYVVSGVDKRITLKSSRLSETAPVLVCGPVVAGVSPRTATTYCTRQRFERSPIQSLFSTISALDARSVGFLFPYCLSSRNSFNRMPHEYVLIVRRHVGVRVKHECVALDGRRERAARPEPGRAPAAADRLEIAHASGRDGTSRWTLS